MPLDSDHKETIRRKVMRYCSYQERTEKEVQDKLYTWGVTQKETASIIQALKEDRLLDEKRYLEAFIRAKGMRKQWGKRKIKTALIKKGLNETMIQKGLAMIEPTDYLQCLRYVANRKKKSLAGATAIQVRHKLTNHLLQKGYEPDLVRQIVQELTVQ